MIRSARRRPPAALLLALALSALPLGSLWAEESVRTDGVTLRLVAGAREADGTLRGAVLLDLEPGWKTYWIDPGEAGIPPLLDFSGSRGIADPALRFPVPHRVDDGTSRSTVYSEPTAIAFRAAANAGDEAPVLRLRMTLGVCKEICLPVFANLETGIGSRETAETHALLDWAFTAAPDDATAASGGLQASLEAGGRTLTVRLAVPPEAGADDPDIFVAGPAGWSFDAPTAVGREGGETVFRIPVLSAGPAPLTVDALLANNDWAVNYRGLAVDIR